MTQVPMNPERESAEPALTVGGVATGLGAILAALVTFGIDLSPDQIKSLLNVVLLVGPLLVAAIIRFRVWSPASVAKLAKAHAEALRKERIKGGGTV